MAESCDRIVYHLRKSGIVIHVIHLTETVNDFVEERKVGGIDVRIPISRDIEHSLNLLYLFLEHFTKKNPIAAVVAFGGYLPVLVSPLIAIFLNKKFILFLRGNDFDIALFSPRRREILFFALEHSSITFMNSKSKIQKISLLKKNVKTVFLPNGIDTEAWFPSSADREAAVKIRHEFGDRTVIGLIGQLKAKKGVSYFLSTFPEDVLERVAFLFVGEVEPEISDILQKRNLIHKIYPFLNRLELIKYFLACDTVAIPSFYEGMPNVLLEASSLGIPCIGSGVDGIQDFFEAIDEKFLFTPLDAKSLQECVKKFLVMDGVRLKEYSENLMKQVREKYNPQIESDTIKNKLMELQIL